MAKKAALPPVDTHIPLQEKYRPRTLDTVVGHEGAVKRLKGMIASGKIPNAIMFLGPKSAGKTTLARCLAAEVNGVKNVKSTPDYYEMNAGNTRGIDDVRQILEIAQLRPIQGKRRFIVIDEAQQLTGPAMQSLLTPVENPARTTVFVFCSMEPDKFASGPASALASRCQQVILKAHTRENIVKHLTRVAKGEEFEWANEKVLLKIADASNGVMRTAANLLEALSQAIEPGSKVTKEDLETVFETLVDSDEKLAVRVLVCTYALKYGGVHKALMDVTDGFSFINKLLWANSYMLGSHVMKGEPHRSLWRSTTNKELESAVAELKKVDEGFEKRALATYSAIQAAIVEIKQSAMAFSVGETALIGAKLYNAIKQMTK